MIASTVHYQLHGKQQMATKTIQPFLSSSNARLHYIWATYKNLLYKQQVPVNGEIQNVKEDLVPEARSTNIRTQKQNSVYVKMTPTSCYCSCVLQESGRLVGFLVVVGYILWLVHIILVLLGQGHFCQSASKEARQATAGYLKYSKTKKPYCEAYWVGI